MTWEILDVPETSCIVNVSFNRKEKRACHDTITNADKREKERETAQLTANYYNSSLSDDNHA